MEPFTLKRRDQCAMCGTRTSDVEALRANLDAARVLARRLADELRLWGIDHGTENDHETWAVLAAFDAESQTWPT